MTSLTLTTRTDEKASAGSAAKRGLLARMLARRRSERHLALASERLAALSPHLIADIGLVEYLPDPPVPHFAGRT